MNNKPKKREIRLFEAFAGIGSQFQALKNISNEKNWTINSVGIIEWFIPAIIAYNAIHYTPNKIVDSSFLDKVTISSDSKKPVNDNWYIRNTVDSQLGFWLNQSKNIAHNLFDITKVGSDMLPDNIDIFTYSFPCQDISHQGLQKGFLKGTNTRSGLLWQVDRILTEIKHTNASNLPKYLLLENVKAMVNNKNHTAYQSWLNRLSELGYISQQYILNSANFGSSQNRERVFVLSILKKHQQKTNFQFPDLESVIRHNKKPLKEILIQSESFLSKYNKYAFIISAYNKQKNTQKYIFQNYTNFSSENFMLDINYSGTTLTASGALSRIKLFYDKNKIREMLPCECFRYMGFSTEAYENIIKYTDIKPTKQIYLCGNSIAIEVLEAIFKELVF